jgi:hypothetical protein
MNSKDTFFEALKRIRESIRLGAKPVIHFEMHGWEKGIQISNNELVLWTEMRDPIRELNILSKNNVVIVMATCKGANLLKLYKYSAPCPFFAFIGPSTEMDAEELETAYCAFYECLLSERSFAKAVEALTNAIPKNANNYHFTSCYDYYDLLLKEYKKTSQDFVYRKEQIRALVKQAKASGTIGSVNELTKQLERQLPKVEPGELAMLRDIFLHKRSPPKLIS